MEWIEEWQIKGSRGEGGGEKSSSPCGVEL
jgi:hypothetical protein